MTRDEAIGMVADINVGVVAPDVKSAFCTVWPGVKDGLRLLGTAVPKLVPIINVIVAAGDALSTRICH